MSRIYRSLFLSLAVLCCLALPALCQEVTIDPTGPGAPANPLALTVTFSSAVPGNLFLAGKPVELVAHIHNPYEAQDGTILIQATSTVGSIYSKEMNDEVLPENGDLDLKIVLGEKDPLPRGSYTVTVLVLGSEGVGGSGDTHVSVWDGPALTRSTLFGVSYLGALDGPRVQADLDLFKQAGFGWIRFPFNGWLPQGEKMPAPAMRYSTFAHEVTKRGMGVIAAFTPTMTVDPAVDPEKSVRDYTESLLSAAAHCASDIKAWELLRVPPPNYPPNLRGIDYTEIAKGRDALRGFDKTLQAIYPISETVRDTLQLFSLMKLPAKDDICGFHYTYTDIPESDRVQPKAPIFEMGKVLESAKKSLRRVPTRWATDFGFDAAKGSKLSDMNQAALMARSVILNKAAGIERTIWRNDPANKSDLPLIASDGSAMPSFVAMCTTLQMIDGVTEMKPVMSTIKGIRMFVMQFGKKSRKTIPRTMLVAWSDTGMDRIPMLLKTTAPQVKVTDLWGNVINLFPMDNAVIFQVDGYPRFVDLGTGGLQEIRSATGVGGFEAAAVRITKAGPHSVNFAFRNDQGIFNGKLTGEVRCTAWPLTSEVTSSTFSLDGYSTHNTSVEIPLPQNIKSGRVLCEVSAHIYFGNRRMGFMTVPVYYSTEPPKE